ncbi:YcaQ family DNA glycosylase [bacterium]|nr:YcaQ family DNA glycosylase [bacterium]
MTNAVDVSPEEARARVLHSQLLDRERGAFAGKAGVLAIVNQLGYVQIDTISAVRRAHHHVLWTRQRDYDGSMLLELQMQDRAVFEYWGHAMSYMPMEDFRFSLPRMENLRAPRTYWMKMQHEKAKPMLRPVLERIRQEGPLASADFTSEKKSNGWWDWKPAKLALEQLFWQGELMVAGRRNFQKLYDLTERVLPDRIDTTVPTREETARFLVLRGLRALGIATGTELLNFMQPGTARDADLQVAGRDDIDAALLTLMEEGSVIAATIGGDRKTRNYISADTGQERDPGAAGDGGIHLLSPFDNLVIQRKRLTRLFGFDYTIECYVPAAKRKYGYFVLPILSCGSLIGRMDVKADRARSTLVIPALYLEQDADPAALTGRPFAEALAAFISFNGCSSFTLEKAPSPAVRKQVNEQAAHILEQGSRGGEQGQEGCRDQL